MDVAIILKLSLSSDDPTYLAEVCDEVMTRCDDLNPISAVPWSRDATQMVTQLMGPTPSALSA